MNYENIHVILVENIYSSGVDNDTSWEETFTVHAYRSIQNALDFIWEIAKEHDMEPDEGGWSVTLPATKLQEDDHGLVSTTYFIESVEIED